jgi:hypothetical protein
MSEYKRWKHAAWALVFLAACARDSGDEPIEEELDHAHDEDAEPEQAARHANQSQPDAAHTDSDRLASARS